MYFCIGRLSREAAHKRGLHAEQDFRMNLGPRKRSSGGGSSHSEPQDSHSGVGKDAEGSSGVALKKQIGLVSACAIIIGK